MVTVNILGLSHALFGITLILFKEKKSRVDYILTLWILTLSIPSCELFFRGRVINEAFTLLNAPLLYIYIKEIIRKNSREKVIYWYHFMVFVFFYLLIVSGAPQPVSREMGIFDSFKFAVLRYFGVMNIVYFVVYGVITLRMIVQNNREVKDTFAYVNGKLTLFWLSILPIIFILMTISAPILELIIKGDVTGGQSYHHYLFLTLILYLTFFGIRQRPIYIELKSHDHIEPDKSQTIKSQLNKINSKMAEDKLYRNSTISVYEFADEVGLPRNTVTAIINDELSLNFFQFVNKFRLEEVAERLRSDREKKYNILDVAFESGFNSKSSFNSLFKQHFDMTPSQYRKSILQ